MEEITIDWKDKNDNRSFEFELVAATTFGRHKFVVKPAKNSTTQFIVDAEDTEGNIQPICVTRSCCAYSNRTIALTIAEALRIYYSRRS